MTLTIGSKAHLLAYSQTALFYSGDHSHMRQDELIRIAISLSIETFRIECDQSPLYFGGLALRPSAQQSYSNSLRTNLLSIDALYRTDLGSFKAAFEH